MEDKVVGLIDEAIAHHEDNLNKLKNLEGEFSHNKGDKCFVIGGTVVSFSANVCALCEEFSGIGETCLHCPLKVDGYKCSETRSPWAQINHAETRSDAIEAEENMIKVLKECKPKGVEFKVKDRVVIVDGGNRGIKGTILTMNRGNGYPFGLSLDSQPATCFGEDEGWGKGVKYPWICEESEIELVKAKFKVGDEVVISQHMKADTRYDGGCTFASSMDVYKGRQARVTETFVHKGHTRYCLDVDRGGWSWTESMLEKAHEFEVGDTVKYIKKSEDYIALTVGDVTTVTRTGFSALSDEVPCVEVESSGQIVPVDCLVLVKARGEAMSKYKEMEKRIAAIEVWDEKMDGIIDELKTPSSTYHTKGIAILVNDYSGFIGIDRFRTPTSWFNGVSGVNEEGSYIRFPYSSKVGKSIAIRALLTWLLDHSDIKKDIVGTEQRVDIKGKSYKARILGRC